MLFSNILSVYQLGLKLQTVIVIHVFDFFGMGIVTTRLSKKVLHISWIETRENGQHFFLPHLVPELLRHIASTYHYQNNLFQRRKKY